MKTDGTIVPFVDEEKWNWPAGGAGSSSLAPRREAQVSRWDGKARKLGEPTNILRKNPTDRSAGIGRVRTERSCSDARAEVLPEDRVIVCDMA